MKTPRFWQHPHRLTRSILLPASLLYRAGAWADRRFTTAKRAPIPVIAIGNATAGGAGKTPTTLALIPMLRALGHTPHIITRGYGGANRTAHRVEQGDDWRMVGDESLLLATAAVTWVGHSRFASAQAAANAGATIVICDDALQHYALHADINLLVIDGPYGIGNGALLPAGPLRETLASVAKRCNAALIIGPDAQHLAQQLSIPIFRGTLTPTMAHHTLNTQRWLAFAGISRPEKFYASLRELGATLIATHDFADHHPYNERDMKQLIARAEALRAQLITTTKDAVKIPAQFQGNLTILPVDLTLDNPAAMQGFLAQTLASIQPS